MIRRYKNRKRDRFGKYELLEKIASGGMAEVYRARYRGEKGFSKYVALKRILPTWEKNRQFEEMFIDEARVLAELQHQNIVQVFEFIRERNSYYISMEFVDGLNLRELIKVAKKNKSRIPESLGCYIVMEILKGLNYVHNKSDINGNGMNLVHRDISPPNILISHSGEVKLADFGIARGSHRNSETTNAQMKGKYSYMSPEQAKGEAIDDRSDIFSVGILLYELLSMERLFYDKSEFDTIKNVREVRMPNAWEAFFSMSLRPIIEKALSLRKEERYLTASDFLNDLENYVSCKNLHANSIKLSSFLRELNCRDKSGDECESVKRITKILSQTGKHSGAANNSFVFLGRAGLFSAFISIIFLSIIRFDTVGGDNLMKQAEAALDKKSNTSIRKFNGKFRGLEMPKIGTVSRGLISIVTKPAGFRGELTLGNDKYGIVTPYNLNVDNLDKSVPVKFALQKEGYKKIVENGFLSRDVPVFAKKYEVKPLLPAKLSVQVRPWGYIYIPGVLSGRESPLHGIKLNPGKYMIKVHHSPTNRWLSTSFDALAGENFSCIADFNRSNLITCTKRGS